ncbi:zinc uptake transcriptional repressor Zur [Aliidiomarina haloalkalitolerans]|uniref:Ferric uptake regulation protein n=1 Tax=Aliidiomarina haloalkalitolerans TaxID=859059 RepID=A0A432VPQ2_9GAMM|nr:zinc uptake transcriptional repressor Zur [Aliidiomarina haloalkalitolerans]MCL4410429.1 zinc uptake transcriptional repressor Zur [Gammaproteobacteria bacterium]MCL5255359.1 zinc uptake transcriptional repressor Zur [Gammaproteobacteria bacterium]RUO18128.1 transcriptional regulator Zur [Aliidiomarina haloalkalitolerans]
MQAETTEHLIKRAELMCQRRGVRMTPTRREVFAILTKQDGAIGAYDLLELLKAEVPNAKPPTIYRALEFLQTQGFVHKVSSANSYVLCSHFEKHHPVQMLICSLCGNVQEIHSSGIHQEFIAQAEKQGFQVQHQMVEAVGICEQCNHS